MWRAMEVYSIKQVERQTNLPFLQYSVLVFSNQNNFPS